MSYFFIVVSSQGLFPPKSSDQVLSDKAVCVGMQATYRGHEIQPIHPLIHMTLTHAQRYMSYEGLFSEALSVSVHAFSLCIMQPLAMV